jgi:RNA polymerase-interacting CarD/CdnL/TRCF family regulator
MICDMDDAPHTDPADWLEVLIESEADIAAGRIVSGASVVRDLYASLARLEADASRDAKRVVPAPR